MASATMQLIDVKIGNINSIMKMFNPDHKGFGYFEHDGEYTFGLQTNNDWKSLVFGDTKYTPSGLLKELNTIEATLKHVVESIKITPELEFSVKLNYVINLVNMAFPSYRQGINQKLVTIDGMYEAFVVESVINHFKSDGWKELEFVSSVERNTTTFIFYE